MLYTNGLILKNPLVLPGSKKMMNTTGHRNPSTSQGRRVKGGPARSARRKRKSKNNSKAVAASASSSNVVQNVPRVLFPVKTTRRLVYHENVAITSTSGVPATYVFSCNGLYDPNITGTGHQPAGFDQIMLYYNHYYVLKSTVKCTCRVTTTAIYPTFMISVNADTTAITDLNTLQEDGSSVRTRMGGAGLDSCMQTLTTTCNVAKFGGAKYLEDSTQYQGSVAANPAEQSYFHLTLFDGDALNTVTCYFDVTIVYEAVFIEPRDVPASLQKAIDALTLQYLRTPDNPPSESKTEAKSWFRL